MGPCPWGYRRWCGKGSFFGREGRRPPPPLSLVLKCFSKRIIWGPWDLSLLIDTLNFSKQNKKEGAHTRKTTKYDAPVKSCLTSSSSVSRLLYRHQLFSLFLFFVRRIFCPYLLLRGFWPHLQPHRAIIFLAFLPPSTDGWMEKKQKQFSNLIFIEHRRRRRRGESHHFYGLAQLFRFESQTKKNISLSLLCVCIRRLAASYRLLLLIALLGGFMPGRLLFTVIDAVPKILRQWILFSNNIVILWARRTGGRRRREMTWSSFSSFPLCSPSCLSTNGRHVSATLSSSSLLSSSSWFYPPFLMTTKCAQIETGAAASPSAGRRFQPHRFRYQPKNNPKTRILLNQKLD